MSYAAIIAKEFSVREDYVQNIIALLDEGNTIPFIARYRREQHGAMDDQLIRQIADKLEYLRNLDARREEVRKLIEAQGNLTDEISAALDKAATLELTGFEKFFKVILPAASPSILAGFVNSLRNTFIMLVYAEMYGAQYGMGYYVKKFADFGMYNKVWLGFVFMVIVMVIVMQLFEKLKERLLKWTIS
jgi:ABC-type Fe3+ transport system permease subunit